MKKQNFRDRALEILANHGPMLPEEFYLKAWPEGKFAIGRDPGSAGGGPSRSQCAANWALGKLAKEGVVRRDGYLASGVKAGKWYLTDLGKKWHFARQHNTAQSTPDQAPKEEGK